MPRDAWKRPSVTTAKLQMSEEGFADKEPLSPVTPNDPNQADSRGRTMVFKAAAKGNTEIVEWLFNQVSMRCVYNLQLPVSDDHASLISFYHGVTCEHS